MLATLGVTLILAACAGTPHVVRPPASLSPPASPPASPLVSRRVIDAATSMLGQPYRYGGAAPGGFDCSGLTVYAMARAGIRLPRTAQEQFHWGTSVDRGGVLAGDLVFMRLAKKDLHVGIAIDPDHFIHAPSARGHVRIDSLAALPYSHGFLGARRALDGTQFHTP